MRAALVLGLAAFLAQAAPVAAAQAPLTATTSVESFDAATFDVATLKSGFFRPEALRLADSGMPEAAFFAMLESAMLNGFRLGIGPGRDELEKAFPGINASLERAVLESIRPFLPSVRQGLMERYARLFTRAMTVEEMAQLERFQRTPLGIKLANQKYRTASSMETLEPALDRTIDKANLAAVERKATVGMMKIMTADDFKTIAAMMQTPAFRRMAKIKPAIDRLELSIAQDDDPRLNAAVEKAVQDVMARYAPKS